MIGYMTPEAGDHALITNDQKKIALKAQGWDAYLKHRNENRKNAGLEEA